MAAVEYVAVTGRVPSKVAGLEGPGDSVREHTFASEAFRERYIRGGTRTHTAAMSTGSRVVRFVDTIHALEPEAGWRGFQL